MMNRVGEVDILRRIAAPFQVHDSKIFFLQDQNLFVQEIKSSKRQQLANEVSKFVVLKDGIVYRTANTLHAGNNKNNSKLFLLGFDNEKPKLLYENVNYFCFQHDQLLVIPEDSDAVLSISLKDFSVTKLINIEMDFFGTPMVQNNSLLFYFEGYPITLWNLETGEKTSIIIPFPEKTSKRKTGIGLAVDAQLICDDTDIFVSFQAQETNQLAWWDVHSASNGLWHIDPETLELTYLSPEIYDELYLFGGKLFGMRSNKAYQIDTTTGKGTRIPY